VADDGGHTRVGHHPGGQDGIGRRQQCAEEERFDPRQTDREVRDDGNDRRRDRHAHDKFAQRQASLRPQELAFKLEAVTEEDHDQHNRREVRDKPDLASNRSTPVAPFPRANPATTNSAASDRMLRFASPETSAPATSSRPSTPTAV